MLKRNSYLISGALRNFLFASVLTSAATQLAVMVDAIIVSHLVGPDALSAVNVSSPVITMVAALSLLFGTGASVLAAKFIGNQQQRQVDTVFTVAMSSVAVVGVLLTLFFAFSVNWIVPMICPNAQIAPYVNSYLSVFLVAGTLPLFFSFTMNGFVQSDGMPRMVTIAVIAGGVVNIALDLLLVGGVGMGIKGAAIATVTNYVVAIGVVLRHFGRSSCSYHWHWPKEWGTVLSRNMVEGMPMMIGNLMLGAIVFILNHLIMDALGADGMYAWSVCLQVLLLSVVLLNGVGNAIFSIGGMLVGEQDYTGLKLLVQRALEVICGVLLLFVVFVMVTPETMARLFGSDSASELAYLSHVLRIFSLVLIPFAVTTVMRSLFQILEYRLLSMLISMGQLLVMVVVVWFFVLWLPDNIWWGFPVSALLLLVCQLLCTLTIHIRHPELSALTLIPEYDGNGNYLSTDFSCAYQMEQVFESLDSIRRFLSDSGIAPSLQNDAMICCEEVMKNLVEHSCGRVMEHSFDAHVRVVDQCIFLVFKDAGQPFNPLNYRKDSEDYEHLGLKLVSGIPSLIDYKYMYGQNILFVKIEKQ